MPKPVVKAMCRARKRGRGEEAEEEEKKLVRVFGYVTGLSALQPVGRGKRRKGVLDVHFSELMDMMLPSWDPERTRA